MQCPLKNKIMNTQKNAELLLKYINNLSDFKIIQPEIVMPYNHMGATITDTILQAGTKWETVVKPRILKLLKHTEAKTTKGFFNFFLDIKIIFLTILKIIRR